MLFDAHRNSISEWIATSKAAGIDALLAVSYGTNKSQLESHAANIVELFTAQPPRSIAEAVIKVTELTGIERSQTRLRAFMARHKFRCLKTGHIPAKVNTTQQKEWVNTTLKPVIEAAGKAELHLLFLDAAHFVLAPFLCRLWCIVRVFIKASPGRNRINVLGAINAISQEVTTYINTTYINSDSLVAFLKQIREQYNDKKPIAIILDNARYQHNFVVKAVANGLGMHLLFLPPYSPNLNIIERLWRHTKKKILNAEYYDSPAKFHDAIRTFFQDINQSNKAELKTLMTLNFQFYDSGTAHSYAA